MTRHLRLRQMPFDLHISRLQQQPLFICDAGIGSPAPRQSTAEAGSRLSELNPH
jgi:hypothetical protein